MTSTVYLRIYLFFVMYFVSIRHVKSRPVDFQVSYAAHRLGPASPRLGGTGAPVRSSSPPNLRGRRLCLRRELQTLQSRLFPHYKRCHHVCYFSSVCQQRHFSYLLRKDCFFFFFTLSLLWLNNPVPLLTYVIAAINGPSFAGLLLITPPHREHLLMNDHSPFLIRFCTT